MCAAVCISVGINAIFPKNRWRERGRERERERERERFLMARPILTHVNYTITGIFVRPQ